MNEYLYTLDSPTNYSDPSGKDVVGVLIGVAAVALTALIAGKALINNAENYFRIKRLREMQMTDPSRAAQIQDCINALEANSRLTSGLTVLSAEAISVVTDPASALLSEAIPDSGALTDLASSELSAGICKVSSKRNPCEGLL